MFIFIARYNTVRVFEKRRRKIKRKEKKKKKVKKYMVQIGKCESSFFLHLVILIQGKKCDTCVCKEPNNGTYLSSEWLNERMIVKHRSLCIYISFEKNVERHIAKRVKKLKKKITYPLGLRFMIIIFFFSVFSNKKNLSTMNLRSILCFSFTQRSILLFDVIFQT